MKLDRLLAITMTLLNQTRVSATSLAERFEVSLRTIYRDMESINQAGIPIVSFPGSDGGYEIMSGYRIDKQILSLDDFSSIFSALRGVRSVTDSTDFDGLLERIGAIMPNQARADQMNVDFDLTPTPNDKEKIVLLHQAIKDCQLIQIDYLDNKGTETERTIEPMGLFLKGYVWYLYGYCLMRSDIRVFRLSRMLQIRTMPERFSRRNYSLQDVEQQFMGIANFARVRVVLLFDQELKTRVRDEFGNAEVVVNADGTITVITFYSSMENAIRSILSYSSYVTVIEPSDVIEELQQHLRKLALMYKV
jgi:predicted DNA-binding transcriptional regulator YafY